MGILDGKRILITGVLTDASLAFGVAKLAQLEGAKERFLRRNANALETINLVYVINGGGRLAGVCAIRDLLLARPESRIQTFALREPISVTPETDQEEVANAECGEPLYDQGFVPPGCLDQRDCSTHRP